MLYKILDQMKDKPALFPCEKVEEIYIFIDGYRSAINENKIIDKDLEKFNDFQSFVRQELAPSNRHANWSMLIRFYSTNSKESLESFFNLLDKFKKVVLA